MLTVSMRLPVDRRLVLTILATADRLLTAAALSGSITKREVMQALFAGIPETGTSVGGSLPSIKRFYDPRDS